VGTAVGTEVAVAAGAGSVVLGLLQPRGNKIMPLRSNIAIFFMYFSAFFARRH
jgi:hypothetical protein